MTRITRAVLWAGAASVTLMTLTATLDDYRVKRRGWIVADAEEARADALARAVESVRRSAEAERHARWDVARELAIILLRVVAIVAVGCALGLIIYLFLQAVTR